MDSLRCDWSQQSPKAHKYCSLLLFTEFGKQHQAAEYGSRVCGPAQQHWTIQRAISEWISLLEIQFLLDMES